MKKMLNYLLLISFAGTVMVPLTGIPLHKLASLIFLILSTIHTLIYREKLQTKRYLLFAVIVIAFISGVLGMTGEYAEEILRLHRAVSIGSVFFIAIHTFVFHKRMLKMPVWKKESA